MLRLLPVGQPPLSRIFQISETQFWFTTENHIVSIRSSQCSSKVTSGETVYFGCILGVALVLVPLCVKGAVEKNHTHQATRNRGVACPCRLAPSSSSPGLQPISTHPTPRTGFIGIGFHTRLFMWESCLQGRLYPWSPLPSPWVTTNWLVGERVEPWGGAWDGVGSASLIPHHGDLAQDPILSLGPFVEYSALF